MKNLKNLSKILLVMSMLLAFGSCKKDKSGPEDGVDQSDPDVDKGIAKEELLDYYIVGERKSGTSKLVVLYFTQEGTAVKAAMHLKGSLRSNDLSVSNSTFNFDANSDGNMVYTFTVEKDASGKLSLKSYQYADKADANQGLAYAVLAKKSEALAFENSSFKAGDLLFKFSTANNVSNLQWDIRNRQIGTKYYPPPIGKILPIYAVGPEVTLPYYGLENVGFKSNNDEFIGACVPNWKDTNTASMLIERNSTVYLSAKQ